MSNKHTHHKQGVFISERIYKKQSALAKPKNSHSRHRSSKQRPLSSFQQGLSDVYMESNNIAHTYMKCLSKDVCGNEYVDPAKCAALSFDPLVSLPHMEVLINKSIELMDTAVKDKGVNQMIKERHTVIPISFKPTVTTVFIDDNHKPSSPVAFPINPANIAKAWKLVGKHIKLDKDDEGYMLVLSVKLTSSTIELEVEEHIDEFPEKFTIPYLKKIIVV